MSRLSLFSFALLFLGFASCNKSTDIPAQHPTSTTSTAARFSISGPQAILFVDSLRYKTPQIFTYTYAVNAVSGTQDSVRLTLGNLPAGMHGVLSQTAGIPPFTTQLSVTVDSLVLGKYSFPITAQIEDSTHTLAVSVRVQASTNVAALLAGAGYEVKTINDEGVGVLNNVFNAVILSDPADNTHLLFPNLYSCFSFYGVDTADAYLNFANHSFRITAHYPDYWGQKTGFGTYTVTPSEIKFTFTSSVSMECGALHAQTTYRKNR